MAAKAAKPTAREYEVAYPFNVPRNLTSNSGDSAEFHAGYQRPRRHRAWAT